MADDTFRLRVIDSHTGGEPTRVILPDQIEVQGATMAERRAFLLKNLDHIRKGVVLEPRGSDVLVGALLTPPVERGSDAGVVFFNDVGYLGMCGHGTIGVVETLRFIGLVSGGTVRLDTPVGTVVAKVEGDGWVTIENVPSRAFALDIVVEVPGLGMVKGDVAYGGNWFYIVRHPHFELSLKDAGGLTETCWQIRRALVAAGITGESGAEIDHVELFSEVPPEGSDSQNFVQCPGGAYDRSPCGTGTSAKLATLLERGELAEGQVYRQASVTGSVFRGSVLRTPEGIVPTISGQAFVTGEATLLFQMTDPIRWGLGK